MATPGYEPYATLWHLFHATPVADKWPDLTDDQREEIGGIVDDEVIAGSLNQDGAGAVSQAPLLARFNKVMHDKTGQILKDSATEALVAGLLDCLNPYQPGAPYTKLHEISTGIYDHFKGGVYKAKGFSKWASGNGEKVVEYTSLLHGTDHSRLATQWCEVVQWPDGKYRSRFVYRSQDLTTCAPAYKVQSPEV